MKNIPKPPDLVDRLAAFELFENIAKDTLQWLVDKSEYVYYEAGENIFYPDMEVNTMSIMVQGSFVVKMTRSGRMREFGIWKEGHATGVLPFSRMKTARAFGQALEDCYILDLDRKHFVEMVNISYKLTETLVGVMSSRIRDFTQLAFQDEKLMALGKLSAGLAHELNNPATAMVRSSEELHRRVHATPERFKEVITMDITPEQTDQINAILFGKIANSKSFDLGIMEREDRLDDIMDWLEDRDIENGEDIAETLVDFGFFVDDLDEIDSIVNIQQSPSLLWWIESTLSLEKLVEEIQEAAGRISELVRSVKSYSHMDRAVTMEAVDVHEGIRSTVMMLKHEFKKKNIKLEKSITENLPKINAFAGELNQVWTNLIVNAIDAMEREGILKIATYTDRHYVCVEITDNGSGIPEDIQTRIFEPFFTTKAMGEGTGMGLDIVKKILDRHEADIFLESVPGKTTFKLCFAAIQ